MMVGLHADLSDSAFVKKPFDRVSRTDSRGRFTIRGIAPGKYHIFGLMDGNQNYLYDSKTEMIAFCDSIIIPSMEAAVRQDTLWKWQFEQILPNIMTRFGLEIAGDAGVSRAPDDRPDSCL